MKLIFQVCTIIFIVLITAGITQAQNKDRKGSSDYPLISRMPDFWIAAYQESEYESYTFRDEANNKIDIEGHKYFIEYRLNKEGQEPGRLMILKNHENALKKINAEILSTTKKDLYCKVTKEGKEIWIQVHALDRLYRLTIVEREQMEQKVVVNPDALFGDIETTGHAAVYGIYFDHGSAKIKQESKPSLKAIADMLKANNSLKLFVLGDSLVQWKQFLRVQMKMGQK